MASSAVGAGLAGLTAFVGLVDPNRHHYFGDCSLRALTGIWCPACGATRASYAIVHGNVVTAFHDNALWLILAPICVYAWLAWALAAYGHPILPPIRVTRARAIGFIVVLAVFFVVRNLPIAPFTALRLPT